MCIAEFGIDCLIIQNSLTKSVLHTIKPANLAFMYNYDNSPNNDYYFINNTKDGRVFKPKYNPVRKGYKFTGWYYEEECINKFDFIKELPVGDKYKEYKIYAGWKKK